MTLKMIGMMKKMMITFRHQQMEITHQLVLGMRLE
jgi:hypothetical protein